MIAHPMPYADARGADAVESEQVVRTSSFLVISSSLGSCDQRQCIDRDLSPVFACWFRGCTGSYGVVRAMLPGPSTGGRIESDRAECLYVSCGVDLSTLRSSRASLAAATGSW